MIVKAKYLAVIAFGAAFALPGLASAATCTAKNGNSTSSSSGGACSVGTSSASSNSSGVKHSVKVTASVTAAKVATCQVITDDVFISIDRRTDGKCAAGTATAQAQVK